MLKRCNKCGAFEKHIPEYQINGENIEVRVNHVMDEDHYIEWISCTYDNKEQVVYFEPGNEPKATFKYVPGAKIYSYCNNHSLWLNEVK